MWFPLKRKNTIVQQRMKIINQVKKMLKSNWWFVILLPTVQPQMKRSNPFLSPKSQILFHSSKVLPSVGAFTFQCAECFKWRLILTKEKYEEIIREHLLEQPFVCETARECRSEISFEKINLTFVKMAAGCGQLISLTLLSLLVGGSGF
ncbi:hypothetical protein RHMOL_Rhmol12G0067700 [Rhododendron molle]|uniref:Uncharacterized protein n=1 Tax=Rhododendron molle TaxID=49168 RepID=A0ACC0LG80_RHOML|nr:hypothetical protein RHMOL_Rhmol12G0067700 [Rhododendron molle]